MDQKVSQINELLVEVYNDIGKIEDQALKQGEFKDLSITEIHTIEAVGMYGSRTMSEVAAQLEITTGTLTTAVDKLIKKGYMERKRSESDRRIVNVNLSRRGKLAYRIHEKFHKDMVKQVITGFTEQEEIALISGLEKLNEHLKKIYKK
jgi:DNA-binding MarR family transcriptional regulator